jgi:transcriptional regulator with PAS, ATPase and Fis domain
LITGPSATGKELVARAIGLSRYIPFNAETESFSEDFEASFYPLNLSALSPTLIESELFGRRRGAFTGAIADRIGWLEVCPPLGTVFLDEIGEIDSSIQVKLLRALDTRAFQRLGETKSRNFRGKAIAATNRDLALEMRQGRFRDDLYYRLCSDTISLPSLHERVTDDPDELSNLVSFLTLRQFGEEGAPELAREVETWIDEHLGRDYPWPGNVRELRQCISNVLIRRRYTPAAEELSGHLREQLAEEFLQGEAAASEIMTRYFTLAYARHGNYQRTARALSVDRRTVKSKIDDELLAKLGAG